MRILPVTAHDLLVELPDLAAVLALNDALSQAPLPAVLETMPASKTLLIRLHPTAEITDRLLAEIAARTTKAPAFAHEGTAAAEGTMILPMRYDGPDLAEIAAQMRLSVAEVIKAHQATTWRVAFCGFVPGFYYMIADDPRFNLARRAVPRTAVAPGSVGLGGPFCGIYPQQSPGGWQILGTTDLLLWDASRSPAALIQPGQSLRFVQTTAAPAPQQPTPRKKAQNGLRIENTLMPLLLQDEGRLGVAAMGVSRSGALDRRALHLANAMVGNAPATAALEISLGPTEITTDQPITLALTGAADQAQITTQAKDRICLDVSQPFALDPGEVLTIAAPKRGMRSYLARRAGFAAPAELGAQSRDTLAHLGPDPIGAGDYVALGDWPTIAAVAPGPQCRALLPAAGDLVEIEVTLGPRTDWFTAAAVQTFLTTDWEVGSALSRVGMRLSGPRLAREIEGELPSEGVVAGSVQVVSAGQPVVFLADHPVTGGYPVIATLTAAGLARIAQVPPGAKLRFTAASPFSSLLVQG